jgi:membrane-associated protease RseP (regulator of RpoE activity)
MLNETASSTEDRPALRSSVRVPPPQENARHTELRNIVATVLVIQDENSEPVLQTLLDDNVIVTSNDIEIISTFEGQLISDSEVAYEQLDAALKPMQMFPVFRQRDDRHIIHVVGGRATPQPRNPWINLILFILTLGSVLIFGTEIAISEIANDNLFRAQQLMSNFFLEMWRGLPYAISILLILGSHELGHYFAARHHKLAVTLPYFIPAPFVSFLGTFGAFIQLREPMRNRKVLLDVGAAGPLVGLIFSIPILLIGLATSPVEPPSPGGVLEGNSFLYALSKTLVFGRFLPDGTVDVYLNQLAMAGWAGLLLTGINLIPLGQLDGGHILYSLIGNRARRLYYPLVAIGILLAFRNQAWVLWVLLLLLFGRTYAAPLDMITPLDRRRRWVGIIALIVFVVTFVPEPLVANATVEAPANFRDAAMLMPMLTAMVLVTWQRLRTRF